jgi:hypothetical protein
MLRRRTNCGRWHPRPIKDERPTGKRVRKLVKLPDGEVQEFDVWVADAPPGLPESKAQPGFVEHGRVPRRGSGA